MSKLVQCLLTVLFLTVPVGRGVVAGEPARPIRALLVAGGCCHDYANQKGLLTRGLSRRVNIQWTVATTLTRPPGTRTPSTTGPTGPRALTWSSMTSALPT